MEPLGLDKWHCKFIMMSIVSKWLFLHWSVWNSIVRRKALNYTFITFLSDARMYDSNKISGILSKWRPSSRRTSLGGRTTGWSWRTSPSRRSAWGSPSPPPWPAPAASGATWSGGMTWTTRRSQHAWVSIVYIRDVFDVLCWLFWVRSLNAHIMTSWLQRICKGKTQWKIEGSIFQRIYFFILSICKKMYLQQCIEILLLI